MSLAGPLWRALAGRAERRDASGADFLEDYCCGPPLPAGQGARGNGSAASPRGFITTAYLGCAQGGNPRPGLEVCAAVSCESTVAGTEIRMEGGSDAAAQSITSQWLIHSCSPTTKHWKSLRSNASHVDCAWSRLVNGPA